MDPKTITINGVTHTVREWSELSGINRCTINSRLRKGVTGIDLIAPVKNNRLPPITHICKYVNADVQEVRYGEWIPDDYEYYHCSECGFENDEREYITPYCPHCGAKMDLEKSE